MENPERVKSEEDEKIAGTLSPKNNSNGFKDFFKSSMKVKEKSLEELAKEKKEKAD